MNIRRQKYKVNRIKGMSQYNAAIAAGYSEHTATKACRIENGVKGSIIEALEQQGFTDKFISEYIEKALKATRFQSCDVYVDKDEDGNYKLNENSNDFMEVEDWNARHKFMATLLTLQGKLKTAPAVINSIKINNTNGNGKLNGDDKAKQARILTRLERYFQA